MSIPSLPWFFHVDHIAAGQSANYILGSGAFDSQNGFTIATVNSIRRLTLPGGGVLSAVADFPSNTQVTFGFLFRSNLGNTVGGNSYLFGLRSGSTLQFNLLHDDSGNLLIKRGSTTLESTGFNIADGTDRYIEVAVTIDGSSGTYEVRSDGTTIASATGVNTGSAAVDQFRLRRDLFFGGGPTWRWAYMYIKEWDDASTPGFYGPLIFHHSAPDADVSTEWNPDTGAENFSRLNEASIDDDTSYVQTSDDGQVDEYEKEDAPVSITAILAVAVYSVATAPEGGAPQVELGVKDGVDEAYGDPLSTTGSYRTQIAAFENHPSGSGWTEANYNSSNLLLKSSL